MIDANQCNHATEQQLQDIYTCKHELEVLVDNIGYPTTNHGFMVMVMGDGHADPANWPHPWTQEAACSL
jgi:hypothetical protein